jgi:hypothetical protein
MIDHAQYQKLKEGRFASIKLNNGPNLSGFAAQDLEELRFVRLDGMVENEEGLLTQFALRLEEKEIESIEFLSSAPIFTDHVGNQVIMNASFWSDMG